MIMIQPEGTTEAALELFVHDIGRDKKFISPQTTIFVTMILRDLNCPVTRINQQWLLETMNSARVGLQGALNRIDEHDNDNAGCRCCNEDKSTYEYIIRICEAALNKGVEREVEALIIERFGEYV